MKAEDRIPGDKELDEWSEAYADVATPDDPDAFVVHVSGPTRDLPSQIHADLVACRLATHAALAALRKRFRTRETVRQVRKAMRRTEP